VAKAKQLLTDAGAKNVSFTIIAAAMSRHSYREAQNIRAN